MSKNNPTYFFITSSPQEEILYFSEFSFSFFRQSRLSTFRLINFDFSFPFSVDFLDSVQELNPVQVYYLVSQNFRSTLPFSSILFMGERVCSIFLIYFIYRFKFLLFSIFSYRFINIFRINQILTLI